MLGVDTLCHARLPALPARATCSKHASSAQPSAEVCCQGAIGQPAPCRPAGGLGSRAGCVLQGAASHLGGEGARLALHASLHFALMRSSWGRSWAVPSASMPVAVACTRCGTSKQLSAVRSEQRESVLALPLVRSALLELECAAREREHRTRFHPGRASPVVPGVHL